MILYQQVYQADFFVPSHVKQTLIQQTQVKQTLLSVFAQIANMQSKRKTIASCANFASFYELYVVALLGETQLELKAGRLDNALTKLREARYLRIFTQDMTNQALAKDEYFDQSIKLLTEEIDRSNSQKLTKAKAYAEIIMHEALVNVSGDSSLFSVHRERMIARMTTGIQLSWHKFYRQNVTKDLDIVKKMSELIASDLTKNDCNKMLFRGGFMAQFQLSHSQILGDVLQAMLLHERIEKPFQLLLPIFEQTNTVVRDIVSIASETIYDWQATLEYWPTMVVKTIANTIDLDNSEEAEFSTPRSRLSISSSM